MCLEQPHSHYAYFSQQGSLRDERHMAPRRKREELSPSPANKNEKYCGLIADKVRGLRTTRRYSPVKRKREITAFGPKHAEQARLFYTQERVLRVIHISPRPGEIQLQTPKVSFSFGCKTPTREKRIVNKTNYFEETRFEMDLKDAPVFQMLCEILKAK